MSFKQLFHEKNVENNEESMDSKSFHVYLALFDFNKNFAILFENFRKFKMDFVSLTNKMSIAELALKYEEIMQFLREFADFSTKEQRNSSFLENNSGINSEMQGNSSGIVEKKTKSRTMYKKHATFLSQFRASDSKRISLSSKMQENNQ